MPRWMARGIGTGAGTRRRTVFWGDHGLILASPADMETLRLGQLFPGMAVRTTDGHELSLPTSVAGHDSVVLFYRGHW